MDAASILAVAPRKSRIVVGIVAGGTAERKEFSVPSAISVAENSARFRPVSDISY